MIAASDGQEALDLVEKCNDEVHLLVTNYNMPRLNGAELATRLKKASDGEFGEGNREPTSSIPLSDNVFPEPRVCPGRCRF